MVHVRRRPLHPDTGRRHHWRRRTQGKRGISHTAGCFFVCASIRQADGIWRECLCQAAVPRQANSANSPFSADFPEKFRDFGAECPRIGQFPVGWGKTGFATISPARRRLICCESVTTWPDTELKGHLLFNNAPFPRRDSAFGGSLQIRAQPPGFRCRSMRKPGGIVPLSCGITFRAYARKTGGRPQAVRPRRGHTRPSRRLAPAPFAPILAATSQ